MEPGSAIRRVLPWVVSLSLLVVGCASTAPTAETGPRAGPTGEQGLRPSAGASPSASGKASQAQRGPRPKGTVSRGWRVYDVVDGDTVKVDNGRRQLTLRLIGIDTPETVHPFEPVGCFGPEASAFAERMLAGRRVALELDRTQGRLDVYGRTLAYVWVTPGDGARWMFNQRAVRRGFAFEYTYDDPYLWRGELLRAQRRARLEQAGLWSPTTCDGRS